MCSEETTDTDGHEHGGSFTFALSSLDIRRPDPDSDKATTPATSIASSNTTTMKFMQPDYVKLLHRAYLTRDGPLFQRAMAAINTLLRLLKYPPLPRDIFSAPAPNYFREAIKSWCTTNAVGVSLVGVGTDGIPTQVVHRIVNETYQRAVGPHTSELSRYSAFSSEVYGELLPSLVSDIIRSTGLSSRSLFVDLGSGVGNVVLQASLQTGCRSFGVEVMPAPARLARTQLEAFRARCKMWGVRMGEVELEEGDMLKSERVDALVKEADVVLVNNKVFQESCEFRPPLFILFSCFPLSLS